MCKLSCSDSNGNCILLAGDFIDGTPCGFSGECMNGTCQESGLWGKYINWITTNPQVAIPITVLVAIFVIGTIMGLIGCCCRACGRGGKKRKERRTRRPGSTLPVTYSSNNSAHPPTFPSAFVPEVYMNSNMQQPVYAQQQPIYPQQTAYQPSQQPINVQQQPVYPQQLGFQPPQHQHSDAPLPPPQHPPTDQNWVHTANFNGY
jgi:hypothetical protein